jgi:penicillin amidase
LIKVKGRTEPHLEEVVVTHHGPIISDVVGYAEQRVAVNSMALRPCPALEGWFALNSARDWDEFVSAMRLIEAPQLNFSYADVRGNIGYWVTGKVPVRAKGDGTVPAPGWDGEHEWIGEVPFEEMPHALNPKRGYLVTTNNRIIPDDYPHWLGNVWMNGYRARRITEILESKDRLTIDDFRALHMDFTCLPGKEFISRLEGFSSTDEEVKIALEQLRAWDGILDLNTVGGTIYEVARYILIRNLLEPVLGDALTTRFMGQGCHPLLFNAHEFYGHDTTTLFRLLDNSNSWWVQQAGGREAVVTRSLKQAIEWLRAEMGEDVEGWKWGNLHRAIFPHPLGLQKPLDRIFNRGPLPIGGDTDTPCQTAMNPGDPYDNKAWAPTFRMIAEPADWSHSLVCVPPGQSGQLGSLHYDDNISLWIKGDYHPMLWTRDEVDRGATGKLILTPGG